MTRDEAIGAYCRQTGRVLGRPKRPEGGAAGRPCARSWRSGFPARRS